MAANVRGAAQALKNLHDARRGANAKPIVHPAPRSSSPGLVPNPPANSVRVSSPTRKFHASETSTEEVVAAFPALEGAVTSEPEGGQSTITTRGRRRSSSVRRNQAPNLADILKPDVDTIQASKPQDHVEAPSVPKRAETTPGYVQQSSKMPKDKIPRPGPAKLKPNSTAEEWLQCALRNQFLPEKIMKQLCEDVKGKLMEESNIQPVSTPVTVCGDLHGQFYDVIELFRIAGGFPSDDVVVEASPAPKGSFTSEDIEPPSVITDPKLKKKMKKDSSSVVSDEDDAEEEQRGRSRGPVNPASLGPLKEGNTGIPGNQNYIFLGDFVDRGYFSLETLTLLLCLKNLWPDRITLVRGNHESRQITQVYGFYEECNQKYGNASVWKACCQVFDFLVLGAIIDGKVLCVHGGLSPEIRTIDQIRVIARAQEIPHEGAFCDLVWSDPEDVGTWAVSPRGAGWLFGDKVASEFNHVNNFELIARAHQLVNEGYKWHFDNKSVVTVWSAPNYCYRCGNVASIMNLGEDLKPTFNIFSAVPDNQRRVPVATGRRNDYFL